MCQSEQRKGSGVKSDEGGSVTRWISELDGQAPDQAQQELWNRYFTRLTGLARKRMPKSVRKAADEEDVALSALDSFFRRAGDGQFPHLYDRTGLWTLLARITSFKAIQRAEYERAAKRGGDNVVRESELDSAGKEVPSLEDVLASEPTPEFVVQMEEQVQVMMNKLDEEVLRRMAQMKLEGYQNREIAESLGIGLRTVERKFARIRAIWMANL